jgi:hypothetical protein
VAVTVWVPTADLSAEVVALPADNPTGLPEAFPSTTNWTSPVGVPEPGELAVTVAVTVTGCPKTEGLAPETSAVLVDALSTCWVTALEVEVAKSSSAW